MKNLKALFLLGAMIIVTGSKAAAQTASTVTLFESKPYTATSTKEQHFEDNMSLKTMQDQRPLVLTVQNGGDGKVPFNWFRLNIAGYLMATEKDLNGGKIVQLNVSGKVQPGGGQILIDAAGEPGATLQFALSTPAVTLTGIEPMPLVPGKTFVVTGSSFSSDENQDSVLVNGQPAQILSASANSITAVAPGKVGPGTARVQVVVDAVASNAVGASVNNTVSPTVLSTNFWMAPPGATLTISGTNFSSNPADNKVYFGKTAAQVVSGNANTLNVIIPNWAFGGSEINIPLWVMANGVRSTNSIPFDIGPKYLNSTTIVLPGESESSSDAYSQASSQANSQASTQASSQATVSKDSEAGTQSYQEGARLQMVPVGK
jgi:hypothetical protein